MSGCREYVLSLKYRFFNDFSLYLIPLMNSRGNDTVFKFQLHLTDIGTRMDWTYFPAQEQYSMIMSGKLFILSVYSSQGIRFFVYNLVLVRSP